MLNQKLSDDIKYKHLFEHMISGFSYHKIVTDDDGNPIDYEFLDVNKSFEKLTELRREDVIGKRVTEIFPGVEHSEFDWIGIYGNVALSGVPIEFEQYSKPLKKWFRIFAYSPQENYFAVTFENITEHKNLEKSLLESKERFKLLYDKAPLPYQSLDSAGNFLDVNNAWLETMGGYTKEEVVGKSFCDFMLPEGKDNFECDFKKFKDSGQAVGAEFEMVKKDGSTILVNLNGKFSHEEDNCLGRTHCIFQDITEQRAYEETVRKAKEQWEKTFNAMSDIVTIQDSEFHIIKANNAALSALDLSGGEIENRHCYELFQDLQKPCDYCPLLETKKTFKPYRREMYNAKFGKFFQVSADPVLDREGKLESIIHVARDITELKQLEALLKESNEFSSRLLENSPNPIIAINPDTSIRFVNSALEQFTGFSSDELVGSKIPYPFWREDMIDKIKEDIKEAMRTGARAAEEPFQNKNGDHLWVEITSTPIFINGSFNYYLAN